MKDGIVLGIDPGSCVMGYGVISYQDAHTRYLSSGCIRISGVLSEKLSQIFSGISEIMREFKPQEVGVESVFMHRNPQSALKLGQARGVAIVAASLLGAAISEYSARQIKQAVVGYGAAEKEQVQHMVCELLQLSARPQSDAADALAVALCHVHSTQGIGRLREV